MTEPKLAKHAELTAANLNLTITSFAGGGAYKETYCASTSTGETVALKIFDPSKCDVERADRELIAMQTCDSPRIAHLIEWGVSDEKSKAAHVFIVEEFLTGGTLASRIGGALLESDVVRRIGFALTEALQVLESHSLVHRDIKPENIMFREGDPLPVLVDFGLVRDTSRSSLTPTFMPSGPGTPLFASPEQLNNEKNLIDWRTDQFGLGVVLSYCLTGTHPYYQDGLNDGQVIGLVASREPISARFKKTVSDTLSPVARMIEPWPIMRFPTPESLLAKLEGKES